MRATCPLVRTAKRGEVPLVPFRIREAVEFRYLRSFLTVAKHRSFTLAAEELFLTQSAVSQQIRTLEAELGGPLFMRERHAVELTDAGRALFPHAMRIVALVDETRTLLGHRVPASGALRIVAATVASGYLYASLYERFVRAHPDVVLSIVSGAGRDTVLARLRAGEADAAFVQFPLDADDLDSDVLGTTEMVAVSLATATAQRLMMWDGSPELTRLVTEAQMTIALRSNDVALLKRFVDDGTGTAYLPRWSVRGELETGAFTAVDLGLPPVRQRFGIAYARGECTPALRAFLAVTHEMKSTLADLCT
ncbi:MAG: LysR family transcriptional regulator [Candidatus Velthaea sp.]|jgi:DNA-binding transcriptional LysR family regulator